MEKRFSNQILGMHILTEHNVHNVIHLFIYLFNVVR